VIAIAMQLEGSEVVSYLNGPNTVRDGSLVSISIWNLDDEPIIRLALALRKNQGPPARVVTLELQKIQEFTYRYIASNASSVIAFLKCLTTENGDFYLSLDPYDEHELRASDKDNDIFRAKIAKLTISDDNGQRLL
jgi:hypothetical protein